MKRTIPLLLAINASLLGLRLIQEHHAHATPSPPPGDMNGDLELDITDPVYLLEHIFLGGPAPVEASSALEGRVVALEETISSMAIPPDTVGKRIRDLERLWEGFWRDGETIRAEGVNLRIEGNLSARLVPCYVFQEETGEDPGVGWECDDPLLTGLLSSDERGTYIGRIWLAIRELQAAIEQ